MNSSLKSMAKITYFFFIFEHKLIIMKINRYLKYSTALLGITPMLVSCDSKSDGELNVLLIAVDDLRPELGCYGETNIISPNIDAFAESGTMFRRAYCNVPVSGASRASLLTGTRPNRDRFIQFYSVAEEDNPSATAISQWFKDNGYKTISNGKIFHELRDWDDSWDELWRGKTACGTWYDYASDANIAAMQTAEKAGESFEILDVSDDVYLDGKTANKTIEDLKKLAESGERFFLGAGFLKPHLPFNAPKKYWDMYPREDIVLPDNYKQGKGTGNKPDVAFWAQHNWSELRHYTDIPKNGPLDEEKAKDVIRGYMASVTYTDAMIGKILNTLEETGLAENTVVLLFGDHGWLLGEHGLWCKHSNFEPTLNTPLIIRSPKLKGEKVVEQIVEYVDIYPTLCDLANIELPTHLDGSSLKGLMKGETEGWKNYAIAKYQNGTTYIEGDYFYTEWRHKDTGKYLGRMLYDRTIDPEENTSLIKDPKYQEVVKDMKTKLEQRRGFDYEVTRE